MCDNPVRYQTHLLVKQVRMSVKFQCKMWLQHNKTPITQEVEQAKPDLFLVNQHVNVLLDKEVLELVIWLRSEKGRVIQVGAIVINYKELSDSKDIDKSFSLAKCLDQTASCIIRVLTINASNESNNGGYDSPIAQPSKNMTKYHSQKIYSSNFDENETKSEMQQIQAKKTQRASDSRIKKQSLRNQAEEGTQRAVSTFGWDHKDQFGFYNQEDTRRSRRLPQPQPILLPSMPSFKRKDLSKLIETNNQCNQQVLKIEILKYKNRSEELQKTLEERNAVVKSLKEQIGQLNKKLVDNNFRIGELSSKDDTIHKLESECLRLVKQTQLLQMKIMGMEKDALQGNYSHEKSLSIMQQDSQSRELEVRRELNSKKLELKQQTDDNTVKTSQINKMKEMITDLQTSLQLKTAETEKILNNGRNEIAKMKSTYNRQLEQLQASLLNQRKTKQQYFTSLKCFEQDRHRTLLNLKVAEEKIKKYEQEKQAEQTLRSNLHASHKNISKEHEQALVKVEQLQKYLSFKEKQLVDAKTMNEDQLNSNKKRIAELSEKNKAMVGKVQELNNKISELTVQMEKLKRNLELAEKQTQKSMQSQRKLEKSLKDKEEQLTKVQKQLTDGVSAFKNKETILRKELEQESTTSKKLNNKVIDLQHEVSTLQATNEGQRMQLMKMENKLKVMEDSMIRANEQIKTLTDTINKAKIELQEKVVEINTKQKQYEALKNEHTKTATQAEIEKHSLRCKIEKIEKVLSDLGERCYKSAKRQAEKDTAYHNMQQQLNQKSLQLHKLQEQQKSHQSRLKQLDADRNKHQKIKQFLQEQKNKLKQDFNKLSKQLATLEDKQSEYLVQIRTLKEEINHLSQTNKELTRNYQQFKERLSETMETLFSVKNNSEIAERSLSTSREISRSRARLTAINETIIISPTVDESVFTEVIEKFSREAQLTISDMADEIRRLKRSLEISEAELQEQKNKFADQAADHMRSMQAFSQQIEQTMFQSNSTTDEYEHRVQGLQIELNEQYKIIKNLQRSREQAAVALTQQRQTNDTNLRNFMNRLQSMRDAVNQSQKKLQSNAILIASHQGLIADLQIQKKQLIDHIEKMKESMYKQEKKIKDQVEYIKDMKVELDELSLYKKNCSVELLDLNQKLLIEREKCKNYLHNIAEEQSKLKQQKQFTNSLLQAKQTMIREQLAKNERIYELEARLKGHEGDNEDQSLVIARKDQIIVSLKDEIRGLQGKMKELEYTLQGERNETQGQRIKLRASDKKIAEHLIEIQHLETLYNTLKLTHSAQISNLQNKIEELSNKSTESVDIYAKQMMSIQKAQKKCEEFELKLAEKTKAIEELQERLFFEKQSNTISAQKISFLQVKIKEMEEQQQRLNTVIQHMQEEIKKKEMARQQAISDFYKLQLELQTQESNHRSAIEKQQSSWKSRMEELCEEYEIKIALLEKTKEQLESKQQQLNRMLDKLTKNRESEYKQHEGEKEKLNEKNMKLEEEKAGIIFEKNKEIGNINDVVNQLTIKLKGKESEIANLAQEKAKLDASLKQSRNDITVLRKAKTDLMNVHEQVLQALRNRQSQLKKCKDEVKNNQWITQKQVKKAIQKFGSQIDNSKTNKKELEDALKSMEMEICFALKYELDRI